MARRKRLLIWLACLLGIPLAAFILVLAVVLASGISKDIRTWKAPEGLRVDAGHLDPARVGEVIQVPADSAAAVAVIRGAIDTARARKLKISISGARHSMGGQTVYPDGIVLDMLSHDGMVLDSAPEPAAPGTAGGMRVTLRVQSGARWSAVIRFLDAHGYAVRIMQSNNPFTVGGTLSVNAHGWQQNEPPFISSVDGFRLLGADGRVRNCTRGENAELFRAAAGGYGLFGVILDADLRVMPNRLYRAERFSLRSGKYPALYHALVDGDTSLGLVYGRLSIAPSSFLSQALLTRYVNVPGVPPPLPKRDGEASFGEKVKHWVFLASVGSGFGKEARWRLEKLVGGESAALATRNRILDDPIDLFENHDSTRTQLLHEYFVPRDSLEPFLVRARRIIPAHQGDLLNLTIRSLRADTDAVLNYARQDVFSLVMLYSQRVTPDGEKSMAAMTRELIDAALSVGGTYYLPYRLHATPEQFARAYPMAEAFFALKRRYDPEELFQNRFYQEYGDPSH